MYLKPTRCSGGTGIWGNAVMRHAKHFCAFLLTLTWALLYPLSSPSGKLYAGHARSVQNDPPTGEQAAAHISSRDLRIEFDRHMRSRVIACFGSKETPLGDFSWSEIVLRNQQAWRDFPLQS